MNSYKTKYLNLNLGDCKGTKKEINYKIKLLIFMKFYIVTVNKCN